MGLPFFIGEKYMKKDFESRFMPNVKFKIPTECIKQFNFGLSFPAYGVISIDGNSISHVFTENQRHLFNNRIDTILVSIYEAMPELIPDGMRYDKELNKLVSCIISASNLDITPEHKEILDELKNEGKTYLERVDIIRNTDIFTPDYYGAKCKCGEKIDAYTICDKYSKPHKGSAWHHAVKKLIRAGDGHKPLLKDIDEVIDSLKRWKEQLNAK